MTVALAPPHCLASPPPLLEGGQNATMLANGAVTPGAGPGLAGRLYYTLPTSTTVKDLLVARLEP